jgi:hypothetical protein
MKFDVVIGNPPYQGTHKKASKLWPKFYEKGFELLVDGGVLVFVAPATWLNRSPRGSWSVLKNWDVAKLVSDASHWFPTVASTFAIPTVFKQPYGGQTEVNGAFFINLHEDPFPANNTFFTKEHVEFIKKMEARRLKLDVKNGSQIPIDDIRISEQKTDAYQYETYHSSAKNRRSMWCSEPHGDHGMLKLIVGTYGNPLTTPEITTKAAGAKSRYILGSREDLEKVLPLIQHPDNMKWVKMMMTDAFSAPLTYMANV